MAKVNARLTGLVHGFLIVDPVPTGEFEDQGTSEAVAFQLGQHLTPIHMSFTGRKMFVPVARLSFPCTIRRWQESLWTTDGRSPAR